MNLIVRREIQLTTVVGKRKIYDFAEFKEGLSAKPQRAEKQMEPGTQTIVILCLSLYLCFAVAVDFILLTADQLIFFI